MSFDDCPAYREAHSHAVGLGGEEIIEDAGDGAKSFDGKPFTAATTSGTQRLPEYRSVPWAPQQRRHTQKGMFPQQRVVGRA
jgi:hypothetical protein